MFIVHQNSMLEWILKYHMIKAAVIILKWKTIIFNCNNISQYYCFKCILDQINVSLVSRRDLFFFINLTNPHILAVDLFIFRP